MFLTGRWQEKIGPAWLTAIGGILCGTSTIIVGYTSIIIHVYIWAFLVGASSSFIYIPAMTVVQQWYPGRRGLISGLVSMVFTAYGFFAGALGPWLSGHVLDLTNRNFKIVFLYLGIFCFASALLIRYAKLQRLQ